MPKESVRTHIVVPRDLVESVDELVGRRARSKFFAEAVEEKLARAHLAQTASRVAGSLAEVEIPGWETSESAARWIRDSRRAGERLPHQTAEGE